MVEPTSPSLSPPGTLPHFVLQHHLTARGTSHTGSFSPQLLYPAWPLLEMPPISGPTFSWLTLTLQNSAQMVPPDTFCHNRSLNRLGGPEGQGLRLIELTVPSLVQPSPYISINDCSLSSCLLSPSHRPHPNSCSAFEDSVN